MKRFLTLILTMAVLFGSVSLVPKKSEALVGVATASPALVTIGGIMAGLGLVTAINSCICGSFESAMYGETPSMWRDVMAVTLFFGGLLVLDESSGAESARFAKLSRQKAFENGITDSERESFNANLPEVNALAEDISAEISSMPNATREDSAALWKAVALLLPDETISALGKVAGAIVHELHKGIQK